MHQHMFVSVTVIVLSATLLAGCATTSSTMWEHSTRPQISIAGAEVQDVRSIAMGSARSKGWSIVESSDYRLVLQRPMDADSPQTVAAGITGPAPTVRVTTYFAQHADGVNVGLDAQLIAVQGPKGDTQTSDYTNTYRGALERSLESLRNTYVLNRHRVMTRTPPLSERTEIAENADDGAASPPSSAAATGYTPPRAEPASSVAVTLPSGEQTWRTESSEKPTWGASLQGASAPQPGAATGTDVTAATPIANEPARVDPKDNMLVLNTNTATGTWAYYAEQYARLRGCELGSRGAELQQKNAEYEIHQVSCVNGQSFQLRCSNGVCRGLQ